MIESRDSCENFSSISETLYFRNSTKNRRQYAANFGGGRCHNLKNGKEATEDTEESPAGCDKLEKLLKISYLSILYVI